MFITQYFWVPFDNPFEPFKNYQLSRECAPFELRLVDCMEAYGIQMGENKCKNLIEDLNECMNRRKRAIRCDLVTQQRSKLYKKGELKEEFLPSPPPDKFY